jgi:hypothetical protein
VAFSSRLLDVINDAFQPPQYWLVPVDRDNRDPAALVIKGSRRRFSFGKNMHFAGTIFLFGSSACLVVKMRKRKVLRVESTSAPPLSKTLSGNLRMFFDRLRGKFGSKL